MKTRSRDVIALLLVAAACVGCRHFDPATDRVRLYALDCGRLEVADMAMFSDAGEWDGLPATLANPCFLIRHPQGDLLWDTGYAQSLADTPGGVTFYEGFHKSLRSKLTTQLAQLQLQPADIDLLAISHSHDDHVGNANLFAGAEFLVSRAEHAAMFSTEARQNAETFLGYAALEHARTIRFDDEHDVFGDGRVVIMSFPGHTAGSAVLQLQLKNAGTLVLTGDLYIHAKEREWQTVPQFTADKAALVSSRQRLESWIEASNARVVIQHSASDFDALPRFPAYLD
ncbi:MAG TPA: N-acyl homoserine lactonase family protein [Arenimonas sp.]|nr:N-acyl homoserine lactonase family protein [Arenimonas sp.]